MTRSSPPNSNSGARIEYILTEMGRSLGLPFMAMTEWGDRWLGEGEPPLSLRSTANGQRLRVALVDERGKVAKPSEVETVISPKAAKAGARRR